MNSALKIPALFTFALLQLEAAAVTRVWDGGGVNANWSTPENWQGDVAPVSGDTLRFPAGAARLVNTNDFATDFAFEAIAVEATGYDFAGNGIRLSSGISVNGPNSTVLFIGMPVTAAAAQTWTVTAGNTCIFTVAGSATVNAPLLLQTGAATDFRLNGVLSGGASLTIGGAGIVRLGADNSYSGVTTILPGVTVTLTHPNALGSSAAASGTVVQQSSLTLSTPVVAEPFTFNDATVRSDGGPVSLTGAITLSGTGASFTSFAPARLTISGAVGGNGGLRSIGLVRLAGTAANGWSGASSVLIGTLELNKNGVRAVPGNITVNDNGRLELLANHQLADASVVTLGVGSRLFLPAAVDETIGGLLMKSSTVETGSSVLTIAGDVSVQDNAAPGTMTGNIRVQEGATPGSGRLWTLQGASVLHVSATLLGHELRKQGPGNLICSGNNSVLPLRIQEGPVTWNADSPEAVIFLAGGTLRGDGRVGTVNATTGTPKRLEPGQSPGIFRTARFSGSFGLTLGLELNGTARGTGYDSLEVTGNTISPGLSRLGIAVGYPAVIGDAFTILNNTSGNPVSGTFLADSSPLAEGGYVAATGGGHMFRITYSGGDGNDIVITKVAPPEALITSFSAVPGTGTNTGFSIVNISASAPTGLTYRLEGSTDLAAWNLLTTFPSFAGVITADFTEPSYQRRFYRFVLP